MGQKTSDYRCLAIVDIPTNKADQYDKLICDAAGVFKAHGWQLLIPAQRAALYDTTGAPPGLLRQLLHVWAIPNFDTLPEVMAYAADDPAYVAAQEMTVGEYQNLYTTLRWNAPIGLPDTPVNFYMMETLHMVNGDQVRDDFANYMDTAVYQMNETYGWKILFAGNATTGVINEYVNVWGMADITKLEGAIAAYRGGAKWAAAVSRVSTSLWTPRPLACFDALNAAPTQPATPSAG